MSNRVGATFCGHTGLASKLTIIAALLALLGACGKSATAMHELKMRQVNKTYGSKPDRRVALPTNPLHRATTYWASAFEKNPKDARAGLSYARNLKALGSKKQAFQVLRRSHNYNPTNAEIASEYGRLALDLGNVRQAQQLLRQATAKGGVSDWKTLSARGTVHAKLEQHDQAQRYYLAALQQNPGAASVLNNLALSYAMDGKADKAEALLREAVKNGRDSPRLRQNLALVLGVQGKFGEAKQLAQLDLPGETASRNLTYLRNMVGNTTAVASASDAKNTGKAKQIVPPAARTDARPQPKLAKAAPAAAVATPASWTPSVVRTADPAGRKRR